MSKRDTAARVPADLRRHRLRIRSLAVSFGAAIRSARRDTELSAVERDALIETWRAWTLARVDECADEIPRLADRHGERDDTLAVRLMAELEAGRRSVREA